MSQRDPAPLTSRHVAALIRGAGRELGCGLLAVRAELRTWSARAHNIPDAELRALVLQGMGEGRALVDGAALFWTVLTRRSVVLLRGLVTLQTLLNFLDVILERDARRLGRPRHWTWLVEHALDADGPPLSIDIINNELGDDGGYVIALVEACRDACRQLPNYSVARPLLLREARRAVSFEIEHEPDYEHRWAMMHRWAESHFDEQAELTPWELAGGASSLLTAMVVLGMAADPDVPPDRMRCAADAYVMVGGAAALLDSYADLEADQAAGAHNWFDYYPSADDAVRRAAMLLGDATARVGRLPAGERHQVIVGAMAALALSGDAARLPHRRRETRALVRSGAPLTGVTLPLLRAWRVAYRQTAA